MSHVQKRLRKRLDSFSISDYHGLNGPGLTCYLNSVLQVLFMTEDFRAAVKQCCSEDTTTVDSLLRKLFADLEKHQAKTHNITKKLGITNVYEQRDAAEYFEKILCRTSPEATSMFRGELNHMTTCLRCHKMRNSKGVFWLLPLAVEESSHQTCSVEKGLKAYFRGERVGEDNKMYCAHCNNKEDVNFGCEISKTPEILTLLLKRFDFDYQRGCYVKLQCKVDVPQTLHVEDCEYDLYALVNHSGNLTGGHYTAQIKSFETNVWYHFDDNNVKAIPQPLFGSGNTCLRSRAAYLLMYRKVHRHLEKAVESDSEAHCPNPDVRAGGKQAGAERGAEEDLSPHHQLQDKCYNGGERMKLLNGEVLHSSPEEVWKRQTHFSRGPDKRLQSQNREEGVVEGRKGGGHFKGSSFQVLSSGESSSSLSNFTGLLPNHCRTNEAPGCRYSPKCSRKSNVLKGDGEKSQRVVLKTRHEPWR